MSSVSYGVLRSLFLDVSRNNRDVLDCVNLSYIGFLGDSNDAGDVVAPAENIVPMDVAA